MTMLRYNTGKVPVSLIPTSFFEAIFNLSFEAGQPVPLKLIELTGQVLDFGAKKYDAHNWRKGGSWSSVMNSALRHLVFRMLAGHTVDAESGLAEAGHLGCNIAFLLEFAYRGLGTDDRYLVSGPTVTLDHDFDPNLITVLDHLLAFHDGGSLDHLRSAAFELARWVEQQQEPAAAAAPPTPPYFDGSEVITDPRLPFKFPAFAPSQMH